MAGSGKTTLLQRLNSELHIRKTPGYIINLDPAVLNVPYSPNIDIRDTVRSVSLHDARPCHAPCHAAAPGTDGWFLSSTAKEWRMQSAVRQGVDQHVPESTAA